MNLMLAKKFLGINLQLTYRAGYRAYGHSCVYLALQEPLGSKRVNSAVAPVRVHVVHTYTSGPRLEATLYVILSHCSHGLDDTSTRLFLHFMRVGPSILPIVHGVRSSDQTSAGDSISYFSGNISLARRQHIL